MFGRATITLGIDPHSSHAIFFDRLDALPDAQPTVSKRWRQLKSQKGTEKQSGLLPSSCHHPSNEGCDTHSSPMPVSTDWSSPTDKTKHQPLTHQTLAATRMLDAYGCKCSWHSRTKSFSDMDADCANSASRRPCSNSGSTWPITSGCSLSHSEKAPDTRRHHSLTLSCRSQAAQCCKSCVNGRADTESFKFVQASLVEWMSWFTVVTEISEIWPKTRMWANAQRDGRPAKHRWRPLFNTAKFGWRRLLDAVQ